MKSNLMLLLMLNAGSSVKTIETATLLAVNGTVSVWRLAPWLVGSIYLKSKISGGSWSPYDWPPLWDCLAGRAPEFRL